MRILDLFKTADIQAGVEKYKNTPHAVLLDVRTEEEYKYAHIPGSLNIPLDRLETIETAVPDTKTPIFVHCQSGARSRRAAAMLNRLGYTQVEDIGGIQQYTGKTERG